MRDSQPWNMKGNYTSLKGNFAYILNSDINTVFGMYGSWRLQPATNLIRKFLLLIQ